MELFQAIRNATSRFFDFLFWHCVRKHRYRRSLRRGLDGQHLKTYPLVRRLVSSEDSKPQRKALLLLVVEPFISKQGAGELAKVHSNYWKATNIVECLWRYGYSVDVTDWKNASAPKAEDYELVIGQGPAFQASCSSNKKGIPKIFLGWGLYGGVTLDNLLHRIRMLRERRGVYLKQTWDVDEGPRYATDIIYIGNDYTQKTYQTITQSPLFRVPNPTTMGVARTTVGKDFCKARRRFLWMAAYGTLRRGLDVVLELFSKCQDYELYICGDISHEKEFFAFYHREIHGTPNIRYVGWVDVTSELFQDITKKVGFMIYPSVSDGMPGSVINAMRAGVVPIVPETAGLECNNLEVKLEDIEQGPMKTVVDECALWPACQLEERSNNVADFAEHFFSREAFEKSFDHAISQILLRHKVIHR